MRNAFSFIALILISNLALASNVAVVTKLIVDNPKILETVDNNIKSLLPKQKMEFTAIQVASSANWYKAVFTYTDTNKGTLFNPTFGNCSLAVTGRVINNSAVTVDSISEDDCGG